MLETAISSALAADVTAILDSFVPKCEQSRWKTSYNTTSRMATAPPLPMMTTAAAGAARPALVCEADKGNGYVGKLGYLKLDIRHL